MICKNGRSAGLTVYVALILLAILPGRGITVAADQVLNSTGVETLEAYVSNGVQWQSR